MLNNIVLIGFMGSGKTTLGRWMMENAGMELIDTDDYIEQRQGVKIKEIFARQGEEYFRDLETGVLKELSADTYNTVVSVGGGMPVRAENRALMRKIGPVVYLRTSQETLLKRLEGDTGRPLLADGHLKEKIRTLMEAREALYYEGADYVVDTDGKTPGQLYNDIEAWLLSGANRKVQAEKGGQA